MKGMLTQSDLVSGLARLGLRPTCHIMVHASLSALGVVQGGAAAVVAALREAAGADATEDADAYVRATTR